MWLTCHSNCNGIVQAKTVSNAHTSKNSFILKVFRIRNLKRKRICLFAWKCIIFGKLLGVENMILFLFVGEPKVNLAFCYQPSRIESARMNGKCTWTICLTIRVCKFVFVLTNFDISNLFFVFPFQSKTFVTMMQFVDISNRFSLPLFWEASSSLVFILVSTPDETVSRSRRPWCWMETKMSDLRSRRQITMSSSHRKKMFVSLFLPSLWFPCSALWWTS